MFTILMLLIGLGMVGMVVEAQPATRKRRNGDGGVELPPEVHGQYRRTKGVFQLLPTSALVRHPANPRDVKRYSDNDPAMRRTLQDLTSSGRPEWKEGHPATVVSNADGRYPELDPSTYRTVVGNRRLAGATHLHIPWVPCIVVQYESLEEEIRELLDHAQALTLNKAEIFDAFRQCVKCGMSLEQTCQQLRMYTKGAGSTPDRNKYNTMRDVMDLPTTLQDAWMAQQEGKKTDLGFELTGERITEIKKAVETDRETYVGPPEKGPAFKAVETELKATAAAPVPSYATKKQLLGIAAGRQDHPWVAMLFRTLGGKRTPRTLDQILNVIQWSLAVAIDGKKLPRPQIVDTTDLEIVDTNDKVSATEPEKKVLPETVAKRNKPKRTAPAPVTSKRK